MLAKIEIEDMGAGRPADQRWMCFMQGDFSPVYVTAGSLSEIWKKMSKFYQEKKAKPEPAPAPTPVVRASAPVTVATARAVPRHPATPPAGQRSMSPPSRSR